MKCDRGASDTAPVASNDDLIATAIQALLRRALLPELVEAIRETVREDLANHLHPAPATRWRGNAPAAAYIDKSPSWLNQSRVAGTGPPYRIVARQVIYDTRDLDAYIEQHPLRRSTANNSSSKPDAGRTRRGRSARARADADAPPIAARGAGDDRGAGDG